MAPLSIVMVIWQTAPFWVTLIAYFLLGESIMPLEIAAMIVCFGAVVCIALEAAWSAKQDDVDVTGGDVEEAAEEDQQLLGIIIMCTTAVIFAFCCVSSRMLRDVPTGLVVFFYTCGGMVMSGSYILIEAAITGEGT